MIAHHEPPAGDQDIANLDVEQALATQLAKLATVARGRDLEIDIAPLFSRPERTLTMAVRR